MFITNLKFNGKIIGYAANCKKIRYGVGEWNYGIVFQDNQIGNNFALAVHFGLDERPEPKKFLENNSLELDINDFF